jgi:hypothetical protein
MAEQMVKITRTVTIEYSVSLSSYQDISINEVSAMVNNAGVGDVVEEMCMLTEGITLVNMVEIS